MSSKVFETGCVQYELEIPINAPCERVWKAIFDETNLWWLPDFHMTGAGSQLTFDSTPGGRGLVETRDDGSSLLWFHVHFLLPNVFTVYLVGHLAPDWGGPVTSHLKLALEGTESGCILKVTDAQEGRIDSKNVQSMQDGWTLLFTDGLKQFVEQGVRHDQ